MLPSAMLHFVTKEINFIFYFFYTLIYGYMKINIAFRKLVDKMLYPIQKQIHFKILEYLFRIWINKILDVLLFIILYCFYNYDINPNYNVPQYNFHLIIIFKFIDFSNNLGRC